MDPRYQHIGEVEDRVIEEMAEVILEICKARRFGYSNHHPADVEQKPNHLRIRGEIEDVKRTLDEYLEFLDAQSVRT